MKRPARIIPLFLALLLSLASHAAGSEDAPRPNNILILNTYRYPTPWEAETSRAFRATLDPQQSGVYQISEENLDLAAHPEQEHKALLGELLREKYTRRRPDLVVAVNDQASSFLIEQGQALFPGVPQIISGGGKAMYQQPPRGRGMTSVFFQEDSLGALKLALGLMPATQRVYVVTGSGAFDEDIREKTRRHLAGLGPSPQLIYLSGETLEELCARVAKLPPNSLIFYIIMSKDAEGNIFVPRYVCQRLSAAANAPVIGLYDTFLGYGILGGKLASATANGETLAKVALRILGGQDPDAIPPTQEPDIIAYDWRQLRRWGLLGQRLPPGSQVRFREYSFFELYWNWILAAVGLLALQTVLIVLLLTQSRQRRKEEAERRRSEKAWRESEQRYRQMFASDQLVQLLIDPAAGSILDANQAACRFYGYDRVELVSRRILDLNPLAPGEIKKLLASLQEGHPASFQMQHRLASGELREVEVYCNPLTVQGQTLLHATIFDITARQKAVAALQESEEKFALIFRHAPFMAAITRLEDGVYLEVNEKFLATSGFSPSEVLGKRSTEIGWLSPADRRDLLASLEKHGSVAGREYTCFAKGGRAVECAYHCELLNLGGTVRLLAMAVDITKQKKAARYLREVQRATTALMDNLPGMAYRCSNDAQWTMEFVSQGCRELTGYAPADLVGNKVSSYNDLIHPEDREEVWERVQEALDRRAPFQISYRIQTAGGGEKWVWEQGRGVFSPQGRLEGVEGFVTDVSQAKRAEEALRLSEEKFSKLFHASPAAVSISTVEEGRFLEVNETFLNLSGFSREEFLGHTSTELGIWTDLGNSREMALEEFRQAGRVRNFEIVVQYKDKVPRHVLWSADPLFYDGQDCLLNVHIDITEHKETTEALQRNEAQFRTLVESAPIPIVIQTGGCIAYINQEGVKAFGARSPEELLGQPVLDRVPARFHAEVKARISRVNEERLPLTAWEYQYLRLDGAPFYVEALSVPFHYQDQAGALVFFRDITQRKKDEADKAKLEAQLRQAQKMEAIGTLAGGIAHDFNNILGAVIGFAEVAQEACAEHQDPTLELGQIIKAGERARDLVRQLLTLSRKVEVELLPLDLRREVSRAVDLLRRTLPKMIDITTALAPDLLPVRANPNQLEQVLLNLATNASDAMPEGGSFTLAAQNVRLSPEDCLGHPEIRSGPYVLLEVSDTGVGMNELVREHIFEPFFTTKGVGKGTGLGLSTVFGIIKGFGGQIQCYSEPGRGTVFKIYLPVYQAGDRKAPAGLREMRPPRGGSETILLVDDDDALRDLGRRMLTKAGYTVLTAPGGEAALEIYQAGDPLPDLVILDLGMPGMGGLKALELILLDNPRAKVVIASGYTADGSAKEALRTGAAAFVAKPFKRNDLLTAVRTVLDRKNRA
ncbi:MAG: PAS domain S-box protein [Deltaproteobacteria bacterium]|nr:PAS domain S-box protein [Deltaproteobacteria bacterium]